MNLRRRGALPIAIAAAGVAVLVLLPALVDVFTLMQLTLFAAMAILALSQGLIWGYGGILSFGQTAFFGLGGYAYAIAAINFGDSTGALVLATIVPAVAAAVLGYFVFYGRVSDVYLGVITLTVSLILFNAVNSTSGDQYRIGVAALGGFNGIPSVPSLNMPFDKSSPLDPTQTWYVTGGSLLAIYLMLRLFLTTRFGRFAVAVRENETRATLLGYDPRVIKLGVFVLGGAIAGFAGSLYVNWGAFVSPTIFGLSLSAEIIIWVIAGGRGTLIGPIVGCVLVQYAVAQIGTQQLFNANLVLGAILLVFVLLIPKGIVPTVRELFVRWRQRPTTRRLTAEAADPLNEVAS